MAVRGIAFTLYPVSDLDRAIAFYRDTLGVPFAFRFREVYAEFTTPDGASFGLCKLADAMKAKHEFPMNVGEPGTGISLALEVDDIGETAAELAAKGIATPPATETPVCWMTTVDDPDGNRIILHQLRARHDTA